MQPKHSAVRLFDMANMMEEKAGPPCILCGGDTFTWGTVQTERKLRFTPKTPFWEQFFALWPRDEPLAARACNNCGNVALFLNKD